jgi:hypothetical protein
MKRINAFISDYQYTALQQRSQRRDISMAEILRAAIDLYLRSEKEGLHDTVPSSPPAPRPPPEPTGRRQRSSE